MKRLTKMKVATILGKCTATILKTGYYIIPGPLAKHWYLEHSFKVLNDKIAMMDSVPMTMYKVELVRVGFGLYTDVNRRLIRERKNVEYLIKKIKQL